MITYNEFINSGLPISDDLPDAEVDLAIATVTNYIVRPQLTDEFYNELLEDNTLKEKVLEGGLRAAYLHFTFAYIIYNAFRVTRFGTVEKLSDESSKVGSGDIYYISKRHQEIGQHYLCTIRDMYNIKTENQNNFQGLVW